MQLSTRCPIALWRFHLGLANFVGIVIELAFAVVAFDREDLAEDRFEAGVFLALFGRYVGLEEFRVGIGLQFDHVRRRDDLFDLAEVDSFCGSR